MAPLLLLVYVLSAQDKPPETCTLSGTVVDWVTGEPLNKVEVRLEAAGARQRPREVTYSDAEGRFTMVGVEAGNYHLSGARNGYLETAWGARTARSDGTLLRLEAGQKPAGMELKLMPYGVIAGTIRNPEGEPLSDVRVTLSQITYEAGKPHLDNSYTAETDDLGQYRLRNLQPGRYYVGATASRENYRIDRSPGAGPREDLVPTVYPGSPDPALAAPVEVRMGAHLTGIDVTMVRVRTFTISGRVVNAAGPVAGIYLALQPRDRGGILGRDLHTEVRNPQGDFDFRGVPPGDWEVTARKGDQMGRALVQVASANVEGVRVTLGSGAKVRVRVAAEGDAAPDLARTLAELDGGPRTGVILGVNGRGPYWGGDRDPTVMPDRYRVRVLGVPQGFYVKSIRAGETDVAQEGLNVEPGAVHEVLVMLAGDGGKLTGTVIDSAGGVCAGATVLLVPEARLRQRMDRYLIASTDQYGHFELSGVPPGDYKAFAGDDPEAGIWFDPEFLREREKQGVEVTVRARGVETVKLQNGSLDVK